MTAEPQSRSVWGEDSHPQPGPPPQAYPPLLNQGPHFQPGYPAQGYYTYPQAGQTTPAPGGYYMPPQYAYGAPTGQMSHIRKLPGVGGVIVGTAFLGVFGAFFAASKARYAASVGASGKKYWIAFAVTLGIVWTLGMISVLTSDHGGRGVTPDKLEKAVITQGDFRNDDGTTVAVKDAACTASKVDAAGAGTYRCMVDFEDGEQVSYGVTVDSNGRWVTDGGD
ncbi:hypothetical protein AB0368_08950 [Actinoplanes sp. NPDC051475]|uniref:hypothetical protein n=1 Tax=Actinoplanes sp. NPDC051475 TaxID=3157225 RepID=UPI00344E5F9B